MSSPPKNIFSSILIMFPLALVLFELSVYMGNDMVQPAMIMITQEFQVDSSWAASSMSAYILGGAVVACILGPLSDRYGRKKILIYGVCFFVLTNLIILLSSDIKQFLFWRLLQGMALSFISAVGYASIQEVFKEKDAIKVMAVMANVSLIAPLAGPVLGAILIEYMHWQWGFVFLAALALVSGIGLKKYMPSYPPVSPDVSIPQILMQYRQILTDKSFLGLALGLPLIVLPILLWIAFSPLILMEHFSLSALGYGLWQIPVLSCLFVGNLVVIRTVDRLPLGKTVFIGIPIMLLGSLLLISSVFFVSISLYLVIVGMMFVCFGQGISFSILYRFTLMSGEHARGITASAASVLLSVTIFIILELTRWLYTYLDMYIFVFSCFISIALWLTLPKMIFKRAMVLAEEKQSKE